jgi:hypothetical protein
MRQTEESKQLEGGVDGVGLMGINSVSQYRNKLISSNVTQRHARLQFNRVNTLSTPVPTSCNVRGEIKKITLLPRERSCVPRMCIGTKGDYLPTQN